MPHTRSRRWIERAGIALAAVGCGLAAAHLLRAPAVAETASGGLLFGLTALTGVAKSGST